MMNESNDIDISIIIVNYNTIDLLSNSIDSILSKTCDIRYEVIVVDNDSLDNSIPILRERYKNMPNFYIIESGENLGFGRANNKGLEIAKGRNVFFLNPDTILLNNAIRILSFFLDENPSVGICGGNLYDEQMNPAHSFRRRLPGVYSELNILFMGLLGKICYGKNTDFNHTQKKLSVGYITGADMMIRKSVLDKVGGFSPHFFMYYEETELAYRVKTAGYKIKNVSEAKIQHLEGKSFGEFKERRERMIFESRAIYNKLTMQKNKRIIVDILQFLSIKQRVILHSFFQKNKQEYWKRKLNLYREFYR